MRALSRDLRFSLRMLVKRPGTTFVAIFTLALAIGANTSIFSAVNAALLKPLPYEDPDALVIVLETQPDAERLAVPYFNYLDYRAENTTLRSLAAMCVHAVTMTGKGNPEGALVEFYSQDMLPTFGVTPLLGRNFLPEEDAPNGPRAVILQHDFWTQRFGADPKVLGTTITLDGNPWTIVGVTPPSFKAMFPSQMLLPLGTRAAEDTFTSRAARPEIYLIGRMKPGVSVAEVRADLMAIGDGLAARYPGEYGDSRPLVRPLNDELTQTPRGELTLLMGAALALLLIAAVNVANLMLERAMARQQEMQIRAALGSGRWRLIRQLLVESLLIALISAGLGLLIALWGVDLLAAVRPTSHLGLRGPLELDAVVLAYTLAISLGTGVLFGLVPALHASRQDLGQALKDVDHHASAGGKRLRVRGLLVIGEVSLALVLLVAAVLAVRGLVRMQSFDPGFELDGLAFAGISASPVPDAPPAVAMQFWEQVRENIAAIPGVEAVGWSPTAPLATHQIEQFLPPGAEPTPENMRSAMTYLVSPGFLEALKVPVLAGRTFGPHDVAGTPPGLIIDEALADAFFPGQDPIGQRLVDKLSGLPSLEIIGVVGHLSDLPGTPAVAPYQMYYAFAQLPEAAQRQVRIIFMHLVIRHTGDLSTIAEPVRAAVAKADPLQPVLTIFPYRQHGRHILLIHSYIASLLAVFAGLALALAAIGLYAVMSNIVAQRTRELGVRMALGAQPRAVVRLVVRQGMVLVGVGVLVGAVGAVFVTQAMAAAVPDQIDAADPWTLLGVALTLLVVGLTAAYIPARRATRIDPMVALRHQ